jgi:hypothetical protein
VIDQVHLVVVISKTHTDKPHSFGILLTSDQLAAVPATYATHDKHKARTSVLLAGFERAASPIKRLHTL